MFRILLVSLARYECCYARFYEIVEVLYDNDFSSIIVIDIYFYETFSTPITSSSFNYLVVIIVCIAFESSVINLI
jgi:hypothetical protein